VKLLFQITPDKIVETYQQVRRRLRGYDGVIFSAMATVTSSSDAPFQAPTTMDEYAKKHAEIASKLKFSDVLKGRETALRLLEEVWRKVGFDEDLDLSDLEREQVRQSMRFRTVANHVEIALSKNMNWAAHREIEHRGIPNYRQSVVLDLYNTRLGEIVPPYVVEYVNAGLDLYSQGLNSAATALLSIAMEATLRDVLAARGYTHDYDSPSTDVYLYAAADVGTHGDLYTLAFRGAMPKSASELHTATCMAETVQIKIRRTLHRRKSGDMRTDLHILAPQCLIDHWSVPDIEAAGNPKHIDGLGDALRAARGDEGILRAERIPTDFDEVIRLVRNPLVHLSSETMERELGIRDASGTRITLQRFLDDPMMVFDFVTNIIEFVNDSYVELKAP
jgi:hypothetical protein